MFNKLFDLALLGLLALTVLGGLHILPDAMAELALVHSNLSRLLPGF